jgi:hypothetical protein
MLVAILRDADRRELGRATHPGNDAYLIQRDSPYRHLSELSEFSFDTFGTEQMPDLIDELLDLRQRRSDPDERAHIDTIIQLARRAHATDGATLTFAPA